MVIEKTCGMCGAAFQTTNGRKKWCSDACRNKAKKQPPKRPRLVASNSDPEGVTSVAKAVVKELNGLGLYGTAMGNAVLAIAERIDDPSISDAALVAAAKEFRVAMAELESRGGRRMSDPLDDLAARRAKRQGGTS